MYVHDRIHKLCDMRGWTDYVLAEKAGLTQAAISSWFTQNKIPNVSSLEKVCHAFGITLSQFFAIEGETFVLTDLQRRLIDSFDKLEEEQKQKKRLIAFLSSL